MPARLKQNYAVFPVIPVVQSIKGMEVIGGCLHVTLNTNVGPVRRRLQDCSHLAGALFVDYLTGIP